MTDSSDKVEHLKMVQRVIARMAGNSVQMKAWTVPLVSAVVVFTGLSDDPHWLIGVGGCLPILSFWLMDAKYLHLERCYRKLHQGIVEGVPVKSFDLDSAPMRRKSFRSGRPHGLGPPTGFTLFFWW